MKCPKCDYLGFETGDRCKNCGYDFSLAANAAASTREPELLLREPEPFKRDADRWLNQLEARLDNVRPAAQSASAPADPLGSMTLASAPPATAPSPTVKAGALPLFHTGSADSDEPLIKVPAAPRPPLAVRRTPAVSARASTSRDGTRLRTVAKPVRRIDDRDDPVLAFAEEPPLVVPPARVRPAAPAGTTVTPAAVAVSGPGRRLFAAAVDLLILLSIDVAVIYFTFQIAGVPFSSWQAIPVLPLALFLTMVKVSYFSVFTMLGGQTVGKMATGIRVVADNDRDVEPAQAVQRTLAALASVATVGIGFAPVLLGGDRRALHDRVARTRVVRPVHE
jgi:uncharacterized RDD family membrane protein YckC